MIRSRFYTIMIVPDARSSIRTFLVNRITVCVALLLVLGSAIGAGLLVKEHLAARSEIASMKEQVAKMVVRLLNLAEQPQEDAADALAIAICHYHQLSLPEELRAKKI